MGDDARRKGREARRRARILAFCLLGTLSLLGEGLSFILLRVVLRDRDYLQQDLDGLRDRVATERLLAFGESGYDAELGWVPRAGDRRSITLADGTRIPVAFDQRGARHDPLGEGLPQVSCYGDSFTFGDEVRDDETWPHHLARLMGKPVPNFGVPGYGTDQAVWRLRQNLPGSKTPVVVVGVFAENIGRLLSMYRPFYFGGSHAGVKFKPMLLPDDDGYARSPNPLPRPRSREDFLLAFDVARRYDYWYRWNQEKPLPRFPYLGSLLRAGWFLAFDYRERNLYELEDATGRMRHLLVELRALGEEHGFQPVVVFIPRRRDLEARLAREATHYAAFLEECRRDPALSAVRFVDVMDRDFDVRAFNVAPLSGHTSSYGNEVIARAVQEATADLIDTAPPRSRRRTHRLPREPATAGRGSDVLTGDPARPPS